MPGCQKCNFRGIVPVIGSEAWAPCSCSKVQSAKNALKTSGIPDKPVLLKDFDLRYYSTETKVEVTGKTYNKAAADALNAARRFANKPTDGIVLIGPAGRGKTMLARCTAHELLLKGIDLIFIVVPDLLTELKDTYQNDSDRSELDVLEAARKVKVLFLDDLGAHNYTEWVKNQLYSIINYRINNHLPTFITSNITVSEMYDALGDRITSRIRGMCDIHFMSSEDDIRVMKKPRQIRSERSA